MRWTLLHRLRFSLADFLSDAEATFRNIVRAFGATKLSERFDMSDLAELIM